MSFLHSEPNWIDYGVPNSGWRGHGGISLSEAGDAIPQYSLQAAWKRNIIPKCYGFVEGLIPPETVNKEMGLLRPPGHFRFDQKSEQFTGRNQLAAKNMADMILIWTVSDRSERKRLFSHTCTKSNSAELVLSYDPGSTKEFIMDDYVNELRTVRGDESAVWVRSRNSLNYFKEDANSVFSQRVNHFEESPYLFGDLSIIDHSGRIWSGTSGHTFTRSKVGGEYFKCLSHSDHPKILFAAGDHSVSNVDVRLESSTPSLLFEVPIFTNFAHTYKENSDPGIQRRPTIKSVHHVPSSSHCALLMTDYAFYLVDQRVPRRSLLSVSHIVPYGGHVFLPAQPVKDSMCDGSVVSVYALDHSFSGIWRTAIYHHGHGESWSSVVPFSNVGHSSDASKLIQSPSSRLDVNPSSNPIRGFSSIDGLQDRKGRRIDLLIRCLDDSSVAYQVLRHGDFGLKKEKKMWNASYARLLKWEQSSKEPSHSYDSLIQEHLRTSRQSSTMLMDVECSLKTGDQKFAWNTQIHPLRRQISKDNVKVPLLTPPDPRAPFSKAVLYVWEKSSRR